MPRDSDPWRENVTRFIERMEIAIFGEGDDNPGLLVKMDRHCQIEERRARVMNVITTAALGLCVAGIASGIVFFIRAYR